jgi:hypothetical protein
LLVQHGADSGPAPAVIVIASLRKAGRRYEMKKIKIRKVGPVRLTAAACSIYKAVN